MVDRIQADGAISQVAHTTNISREDLAAVPAPQNADLRHRAITSSSRIMASGKEGVDLVPHINGIDHLIRDMKALSSNELLNKKLDQILAKIFPAYGAMKAGHAETALQKQADEAIGELKSGEFKAIVSRTNLYGDVPGDAIPSSSDNMNTKVYAADEPLMRMEDALKQIAQMRQSMEAEDAQRYQRMLSVQKNVQPLSSQQRVDELTARAVSAISSQPQLAVNAHASLSADMTLMVLS